MLHFWRQKNVLQSIDDCIFDAYGYLSIHLPWCCSSEKCIWIFVSMKKNKKWEGKYQPLRCTLSRVLMKCARGCTSIWWMCNCSFFSETTDGFDLKRIVEQTSVTFKSCCCCVHGCCSCFFIRSFRCACNVIWNVWKHWPGTLLVAPDTQIELQVIPKY